MYSRTPSSGSTSKITVSKQSSSSSVSTSRTPSSGSSTASLQRSKSQLPSSSSSSSSSSASVSASSLPGKDDDIYTVRGMYRLMHDPERGVEVKTRYNYLKSYKKCFQGLFSSSSFLCFFFSLISSSHLFCDLETGNEAVTWIMDNIKTSTREEAVALGQVPLLLPLASCLLPLPLPLPPAID